MDEVLAADECFCTGTAVVVVPVGSVTHRGEKTVFQEGGIGPARTPHGDEDATMRLGKRAWATLTRAAANGGIESIGPKSGSCERETHWSVGASRGGREALYMMMASKRSKRAK